jgi:hypothetical protein
MPWSIIAAAESKLQVQVVTPELACSKIEYDAVLPWPQHKKSSLSN